MNGQLRNITVRIGLSEYGDALLYGLTDDGYGLPGMALKQLLFAWHEESFYGTELAIHKAGGIDLVVLPAEQVLSFFAAGQLLSHIGWSW
ncbi:hypothetical protein, partial [Paenibacillus zanthoxyli]|uniref:hypothetical protein n=1 Tax=Paenibacillus zanthoxyli TaxID=369399 RepID=UPI00055F5D7A